MAIFPEVRDYDDFDASTLVEGQGAIIVKEDPDAENGLALMVAFGGGRAKRLLTADDIVAGSYAAILPGEVDAVCDGDELTGARLLSLTGLTRLCANLKDRFASRSHVHDASGIEDGAITEAKLADGAVTEGKIADGAVTEAKLADGSVTGEKLGEGAVGEDNVADGAITKGKLDPEVTAAWDSMSHEYVRIEPTGDFAKAWLKGTGNGISLHLSGGSLAMPSGKVYSDISVAIAMTGTVGHIRGIRKGSINWEDVS